VQLLKEESRRHDKNASDTQHIGSAARQFNLWRESSADSWRRAVFPHHAAGLAMLRMVFGERLDFVRRYAGGHQVALLAALADDQVWPIAHAASDGLTKRFA
jgi:hypothetical protein